MNDLANPIPFPILSSRKSKTGAEQSSLFYGIHATHFGDVLIAGNDRGISEIQFVDADQVLRRKDSKSYLTLEPSFTQNWCNLIFGTKPDRSFASLTLVLEGTDFQLQVWQALLKIPFGKTTTYQTIAEQIGRPKAIRAVGNAVGNNPLAYLIPCHRVLRSSGQLGGYRWGLDRKIAMLNWEAHPLTA